jgi:hypothetical protein
MLDYAEFIKYRLFLLLNSSNSLSAEKKYIVVTGLGNEGSNNV